MEAKEISALIKRLEDLPGLSNCSSKEELILTASNHGIELSIEDLEKIKTYVSDLDLAAVHGGGAAKKASKGFLENILGFDLGVNIGDTKIF